MSEEPTKDIGQKYDTRPILENILTEMRSGFEAINRRIDEFEGRVNARLERIENRLDKIERKIKILNDDVLSIRADIAGVDQRVTNLEESRA